MTTDLQPPLSGARRAIWATTGIARELVEAFVIAVLFALFVRTFVFQAFKIPSSSMEQNLLVGDHILVNKFVFAPILFGFETHVLPERQIQRGDVVVFRYPHDPSRDFIKRCLGLPGDTIELRNKHLLINGQDVDESSYTYFADDHAPRAPGYLAHGLPQRDNFGPFVVPIAEYFCLGDNRDLSNDSRFWGTVPASFVKGRALLVYWSVPESPSTAVPSAVASEHAAKGWKRIAGPFAATRWERSFKLVR